LLIFHQLLELLDFGVDVQLPLVRHLIHVFGCPHSHFGVENLGGDAREDLYVVHRNGHEGLLTVDLLVVGEEHIRFNLVANDDERVVGTLYRDGTLELALYLQFAIGSNLPDGILLGTCSNSLCQILRGAFLGIAG